MRKTFILLLLLVFATGCATSQKAKYKREHYRECDCAHQERSKFNKR